MYITKAQYAKMLKAQARRRLLLAINNAIGVILLTILGMACFTLMCLLA